MRPELSIRFAIEGDLRFISHRDTLRLFERALARSGLPVRTSGEFNPRPRVSLPLPRNVGVASRDERLIVELLTPLAAEEALKRLAPQMPNGVQLLDVEPLRPESPRRPALASYELTLEPDEDDAVRERVERFLAAGRVDVVRDDVKTGRRRPVDVRSYVCEMSVDSGRLVWTQRLPSGGTARPGEVLEALGIDPKAKLHRLVRTHVEYAT